MDATTPPYPREWEDDQVMNVMMAPFRESRDVNPSSWDNKLKFWFQMIRVRCFRDNQAVFHAKSLPSMFTRKGKLPICLPNVLRDMERTGHIQKLADFQASVSGGSTWFSTGFSALVKKPIGWTYGVLLKKPLSWTYSAVFGEEEPVPSATGVQKEILPDEHYVLGELVQDIAEKILARHESGQTKELTDCMYDYKELSRQCRDICSDDQTFQLALLRLSHHKHCHVTETSTGEKIVTFTRKGEKQASELTEDTLKIYRLKTVEHKLLEEIEQISREMEKCRLEAKLHLQKGMKASAKNCLKQKRRLETLQRKRETGLDNIQQLLASIQQAETTKQIFDAYSSGVAVFKRYGGLTAEMVDDVMVDVQGVMDTQDDLDRSMAQPPEPVDEPSLAELEEELDSLLAEEEGGGGELPTAPSDRLAYPRAGTAAPHQEMIDAMCQMKVIRGESDLPNVPAHAPGTPPRTVGSTRDPLLAESSPGGRPASRKLPMFS